MIKSTLALTLMLLAAAPATAQSQLFPDEGREPFWRWLEPELGPGLRAAAWVSPSFEESFLAGVREHDGMFFVFAVENRELGQLMDRADNHESVEPSSPAAAPSRASCTAPLRGRLGPELVDAWARALRAVQPGEKLLTGLDGEMFHFTAKTPTGWLRGQTWSPDEKTPPGRLVAMVEALRTYCHSGNPGDLKALTTLLRRRQD